MSTTSRRHALKEIKERMQLPEDDTSPHADRQWLVANLEASWNEIEFLRLQIEQLKKLVGAYGKSGNDIT